MGGIATVEVDNGKSIIDGGNDAPPLEEAKANQRLISTAPTIHQLLERVITEEVLANDLELKSELKNEIVKVLKFIDGE